ncbi:MFS transporter [Rathayibacter sp. Leaf299]|uniref:MFS transporter n=1 Tax=Rathayibacter sp. Leaf299 TaxID=1736328 RepID=UPI0006F28228|nr:MFS transporter [Rathayibacter sp. Leaf299]KQQ20638.1 MFS transporter [Rathayibacter sp. Leaf299]
MTATAPTATVPRAPAERMPWAALMILAAMGFVLVAAETMPAGLLPVIADGMGTSEGVVGQFVSVWALGTVIVTVPAISLTRGFRRKPLILAAIAGLVLANTVTALSSDVTLSLVSRFVAGAFTGVIWGMLAAYGRRISPESRGGLSLAVVSTGAPLGFALGTPLGAWLGTAFDWRWSFGGLSLAAVLVLVLIVLVVPDAPGQEASSRLPLARIVAKPGIVIVLAVIAVWMLAHNTIYTYIAPYLRETGSGLGADVTLLVYGIASVAGVALTALLIDRWSRPLLHGSVAVFVLAAVLLLLAGDSGTVIVAGAVLWGVGFGGASAQLQAALTKAGGADSDVANAFLPVAFNLAIFAAGILGAVLLGAFDALVLPVLMAALGVLALLLTVIGRRTAFTGRV